MLRVVVLVLFLVILFGLLTVLAIVTQKTASGIKLMLLGIAVILFGGIIAVDNSSSLGGFEYLIVLYGLILTVVGCFKKEKS